MSASLARLRAGQLLLSLCLAAAAVALFAAPKALATFPGLNGKIALDVDTQSGEKIAFVNPDGSGYLELPGEESRYANFSADGNRIVFSRADGLYVANADGSGAHRIAEENTASEEDVTYDDEYVTPEDEDEIIAKIVTTARFFSGTGGAVFALDGATLVADKWEYKEVETFYCAVEAVDDPDCIPEDEPGYYEDREYNWFDQQSNIVSIGAADGAVIKNLSGALPGWVGPMDTATDGRVAFGYESTEDFASRLYTLPAGGGAPQLVSGVPSGVWGASFSPDGTQIAYRSAESTFEFVPTVGGTPRSITVPAPAGASGQWLSRPIYSPDGTRVAFERTAFGPSNEIIEEGVYTLGVDGTGLTRIAADGIPTAWQALAPAPAPAPVPPAKKAKAKAKKQVKLDRKGKAVIGSLACGSSACKVNVKSAKLKIGKKKWSVKVSAPKRIGAGKSAKVKVAVAGKALAALREAGKGKLNAKLLVTDAAGKRTLGFNPKLTAPAPKPKAGK